MYNQIRMQGEKADDDQNEASQQCYDYPIENQSNQRWRAIGFQLWTEMVRRQHTASLQWLTSSISDQNKKSSKNQISKQGKKKQEGSVPMNHWVRS